LFCPLTFDSRFYPFAFALPFQALSLTSSSSQVKEKKRNPKKKKTIEKKKYAEKGGNLPSSSCSTFSFLAFVSALLLLPFRFKHFFLASFSFQTEEKDKNTKKKKCRKEKELTFLLSLLHLG
jgi:hypothetical protein